MKKLILIFLTLFLSIVSYGQSGSFHGAIIEDSTQIQIPSIPPVTSDSVSEVFVIDYAYQLKKANFEYSKYWQYAVFIRRDSTYLTGDIVHLYGEDISKYEYYSVHDGFGRVATKCNRKVHAKKNTLVDRVIIQITIKDEESEDCPSRDFLEIIWTVKL